MRRALIATFLWLTVQGVIFRPPSAAAEMQPQEAGDAYEPNDTAADATLIGVGQTLRLTLQGGDVDWLRFWLKSRRTYRILSLVRPGGDTQLRLYTASMASVAESDDRGPGDPSAEIPFSPSAEGFFYAEVTSRVEGLFADYDFRVIEALPTATPSPKPPPPPSPTAPSLDDAHEPNDGFDAATSILVGETVQAVIRDGNPDFFQLYAKEKITYGCDVTPLAGLDPELIAYSSHRAEIGRNDDRAPGDPAAALTWSADATGWIYLRVGATVGVGAYTLLCAARPPTPTPTARPTGAPQPTSTPNDAYEPNYSFDLAADVVPGRPLQAAIAEEDNDFYRLYVKPGRAYRCDVTPRGFDSNLIVYDHNRNGIGGSDDISPADPGSSLTWYANYAGWAYLLVGPVSGQGSYTLLCTVVTPTATPPAAPAPYREPPPASPVPASPHTVPTATGAEEPENPTATHPPPPTPSPTPDAIFDVTLLIYYDDNNNTAPEPREGIQEASVVLLDPITNKPLQQAFTDGTGAARLTHPGPAYARVAVPYLGFSQEVRSGEHIVIRIKPQLLPGLLP